MAHRTQLLARQAVAEGLLTPVAADRLLGDIFQVSLRSQRTNWLLRPAGCSMVRSDPDGRLDQSRAR